MSKTKGYLRLSATLGGSAERKGGVQKSTVSAERKEATTQGAKSAGRVLGFVQEPASTTQKPFAVFDIDGTLIRWQLYHAVVNRLAKEGLLGEQAYKVIQEARMIWKQREHADAFKDYERQMVKLYDQAITGIQVAQFQKAAEQTLSEYQDQTYVYTRDLIAALKAKKHVLLAISGSQQEVVEMLARHYGFDDWVGSVYGQADGHFTGIKKVAAENKGGILDTLVSKNRLTYQGSIGVGDTVNDTGFLEKVEQPIAFNPDRHLFTVAKSHGWKVVIERKNVIYELNPQDGKYILA